MMGKTIKRLSQTFHFLSLLFFIVGLYACEFESDNDNYVHLEKPKENIQLGIELSGVNPFELIYVYNNSTFSYSLYSEVKDIFIRQFFLDGEPITTDQNTGEGYLNIDVIDNEIHELKLVIGLKTGSGSLAEHTNYEMYAGEFIFKIKILPFSDGLNIRETTDNNNNLKIEWDKPLEYEVTGYNVYKGDSEHGELLAKIDNPNKTYFVDTDYAYGYKYYTIVAEIKNSFNLIVKDGIAVYYSNITVEDFEMQRISANEFLIKWENPNPFPCKYVFKHGFNKKEIAEGGINEVVIDVNYFPLWTDAFTLYILPATADIDRYEFYSNVYGVFHDKIFSSISYNENLKDNLMHGLNFNTLNNFDISTMKEVSVSNHNLNLHTGCKLQISEDGRFAISDSQDYVHIFSDYSLKNEITNLKAENYSFQLINDDKILIEERNGFKIYDITNNNVISSKLWQSKFEDGEVVTKTTISPNGKYVYVICKDYHSSSTNKEWVELYEIATDNSLILLETKNETIIQSIYFHPTKNNEVIIQYYPNIKNEFVITDIQTKDEKEIKGQFMNIDPFTGNLLFRSEEFQTDYTLYVWDKDYLNEKIKIKLPNDPWAPTYLFNNYLYSNGHYVDLSNFKEWKQ